METYRVFHKKCVVPGCEDLFSKRHAFPRKDQSLFKKWVAQVRNPILNGKSQEQIYKSYRICDLPGSHRGLKKFAIPTILLPQSTEFENVLTGSDQNSNRESGNRVQANPLVKTMGEKLQTILSSSGNSEGNSAQDYYTIRPSNLLQESPGPATSKQPEIFMTPRVTKKSSVRRRILHSINLTRQSELTPKAKILYKKVVDYGNKMSTIASRLKSARDRLHQAEECVDTVQLNHIFDKVNSTTYNFILTQIRTQKLKPKARRFSVDDKVLALSILKASGKGYRFLMKIFALPSRKTLANFLNRIPLKPGVNEQLFLTLKGAVEKMPTRSKCCILMFDELSLSCQLQYNRKSDIIEGIDNSGHSPGIVDHANVFMVQGIFSRWKQPLCFTFSDGPIKTYPLKEMVKKVISKCQEIGLTVIATVCDQGGSNQAAINSLLKDTQHCFTSKEEENRLFGFFINGQEIVPLYDVPHLFKGLRNNLLKKNLHFKYQKKDMIAKWEHIIAFYYLDTSLDEQMCSKLSDQHILASKMNKMKVSLCMQVFSHQVGSLMKRIALWGAPDKTNLEPEALDAAEFILFVDKLFDSLNVNSKKPPSTKPLKGGVT